MAKTYLTNINLKGNQLLNAAIQPSASAPSALTAGQLYYNTSDGIFYFSTAAGTGNWQPVGVQYIKSVGSNLSVSGAGELDLGANVVITDASQNLSNKTFLGNVYFQSAGGAGGNLNTISVDNNTGHMAIASGYELELVSVNDININSNNGDIVLNPNGNAYIGGKSAGQKIATINDLTNVTLNIQGTADQITVTDVSGTSTISLPSYINVDNGELHLAKTEYWKNGSQYGIVAANDYSNEFSIASVNYPLHLESHTGDITLSPSSNIINAVGNEIHSTKLELHLADNTNRGAIIAHPSDGSLTVAATGWLHLESHDGGINIDPDNGQTIFSNQIRIDSNGTIETNNSDLTLSPDSGNVVINNNLVTDAIVSKNGSNDTLDITASTLQLNSSDVIVGGGGINGSLTVKNSNGDNHFNVDVSNSTVTVKGELRFLDLNGSFEALEQVDGNTDFQIAADYNIVLNSSNGSTYLQSISDGNKIATISDLHAVAQSLSVLGSVRTASDANLNLNGAVPIVSNVTLQDGDRVLVKAQSVATENGIYIFNSSTSTLSLSTNPEDSSLKEGSYTLVEEGLYAAQGWIATSAVAGATVWTQFSAAGEYTAGSGITVSNGEISVNRSVVDNWYDASGSASSALTSANGYTDSQLSTFGNQTSTDISNAITTAENYADNLVTSLALTSKYVGTISGDGSTDTFTITHNLDKRSVMVQVYQSSGSPDTQWADVEVDMTRISTNAITIGMGVPPTIGTTYEVVIVG